MRTAWAFVGVCLIFTVALAQPAPREDYVIGVEDVLQISVWGEDNLSLSVRVRPDGKITFPLVNDFKVEGLTSESVRREITKRLSDYINQPNVTVIVEEINSYKVYIIGKVQSQGTFNFYRPTRLLQAIASAGGFNEFAKQQVTVLRDIGITETRILVNIKRLVAGDPSQENLFLESGDTVVVD